MMEWGSGTWPRAPRLATPTITWDSEDNHLLHLGHSKMELTTSCMGQHMDSSWHASIILIWSIHGSSSTVTWTENAAQKQFQEIKCQHVNKAENWNFEITALAFNSAAGNIITGSHDHKVQGWVFEDSDFRRIFQMSITSTVPKSFAFAMNSTQDIYAFGIYDGWWHTLRGTDGTLLKTKELGKQMWVNIIWNRAKIFTVRNHRGTAGVCVKDSQFIVDNGLDGSDMHHLNNGAHIRTFSTGPLRDRYPQQTQLAENRWLVVGGGKNGLVHLFDSITGLPQGTLSHRGTSLVQRVIVSVHFSIGVDHTYRNLLDPQNHR